MRIRLQTLLIVACVLAGLGGVGAFLFLRLGVYDVAATEQHTRVLYRLTDYALRRAVATRSDELPVPRLDDPQRVARGVAHYRAHCVQCHGAPGVAPEPLAFGLTPAPANLVGTAREWKDAEMFWVVKYGIKMTGMPAWIFRLQDEEIWDVVAFVRASVGMDAREYAALAAAPAPAAVPAAPAAGGGDVQAGRLATERHLCVTCHVIPTVVGADRHIGPPLSGMGTRKTIAGIVPNTPENMVRFLVNPKQFDPQSLMPALGVSERDARDIAAFLQTLDDPSK